MLCDNFVPGDEPGEDDDNDQTQSDDGAALLEAQDQQEIQDLRGYCCTQREDVFRL